MATVSGTLFVDLDGDRLPDAGERFGDETVRLTLVADNADGKVSSGFLSEEHTVLTNALGQFSITGMRAGLWTLDATFDFGSDVFRYASKFFIFDAGDEIRFNDALLRKGTSNFLPTFRDPFEPNDSRTAYTNLALGPSREFGRFLVDSRAARAHGFRDADYFLIVLDGAPGPNSSVGIAFDPMIVGGTPQADLDLLLLDADGNFIRSSIGRGGTEQVEMSFLAPGTYYAVVQNFQDSDVPYRITSNLAWRQLPDDANEPNGNPDAATPLFDGSVSGSVDSVLNASISQGGPLSDIDYYSIDLHGWAAPGSFVTLSFTPRERPADALPNDAPFFPWYRDFLADLQSRRREMFDQGKLLMQLIQGPSIGPDKTFTVIQQRIGNRVELTIPLEGLPPGRHLLRITGEVFDINQYSLRYAITQQTIPPRDSHESNDIRAQATPLLAGEVQGTTHAANDFDWYAFNLSGWGNRSTQVSLTADGRFGSLFAQLTDVSGVVLRQTLTGSAPLTQATIPLDRLPPGQYFVQIGGQAGARNAYRLSVQATGTPVDPEEPNNTGNVASPLPGRFGSITRTLHNRQDEDWYQFDLTSMGRLSDHISLAVLSQEGDPFTLFGIEMELYDSAGNPLDTGGGGAADQVFSLGGRQQGTYFIRVHGNGASIGTYSLHFDVLGNQRLPFIVSDDGFQVTNITDDDANDVGPQVGGGAIVWRSPVDENGLSLDTTELWYFDTTTPGARPRIISTPFTTDPNAYHIDDDGQVVWHAFDGQDQEVFLFDGVTVQQLTDNTHDDINPSISGGQVAWQALIGGTWEIMHYDGVATRRLTTNSLDDVNPQIDGAYIVWMGDFRQFGVGDEEIFLFDGSIVRQLTDNDSPDVLSDTGFVNTSQNARPVKQIDQGQVAWLGLERVGLRTQMVLFFYDGERVRRVFQSVPGVNGLFDPSVSDGQIAWQGGAGSDGIETFDDGQDVFWIPTGSEAGYQIFYFDGLSVRQLTAGAELVEYPVLDDGVLRWFGDDPRRASFDYEVFVFDGIEIRQLTNNDVTEIGAHLNGGQIVWSDIVGGSGDIKLLDIAPRALEISPDSVQFSESAGADAATVTVTRLNTDTSAELVITLQTNDASEVVVPATVVIPAGQTSATFRLSAVDDDLVDGPQQVVITASASQFRFATFIVTVDDSEALQVTIADGVSALFEGGGGGGLGEVFRGGGGIGTPMTVTLQSSDPSVLQVPDQVVIPAGQRSVRFDLFVPVNSALTGVLRPVIIASAPGFTSAAQPVEVRDAESLTVSLNRIEVPNVAGAGDVVVTVTRSNSNISDALVVEILLSDTALLGLPPSVLIPAGESSVEIAASALGAGNGTGPKPVGIFASAAGYLSGNAVVTLVDANRAPVLSLNGGPVTFRKSRNPISIDVVPNLTVQDSDEPSAFGLGGGRIEISINLVSNRNRTKFFDRLSIPYAFEVGTLTDQSVGNRLRMRINLNPGVTALAVTDVLRHIHFYTFGAGFKQLTRTLGIQVFDSLGAASDVLEQTIFVRKK